jgi:hypothetical protein
MINTRLIHRMLEVCDRFERKKISVATLQALLEGHASALEGIDNKVYSEIHNFSNVLEKIQFACLLERQHEETVSLIKQLRKYLYQLVP